MNNVGSNVLGTWKHFRKATVIWFVGLRIRRPWAKLPTLEKNWEIQLYYFFAADSIFLKHILFLRSGINLFQGGDNNQLQWLPDF